MTNPVMVTKRLTSSSGDILHHLVWCPGCDRLHAPKSRLPETPDTWPGVAWKWDGNETEPTFDPSLKVFMDGRGGSRICHSYIRAGRWEFLGDSYHQLRGQTVAMVPVPDWVVGIGGH